MWWLERADLLKRGPSSAHQLSTYPRTANLWLKDRLHDKEVKRSYRKELDFTLKPVQRPDINPLRPDLKLPVEEVKPYDSDDDALGFEIPSSWRERLKEPILADAKKYRLEKEEVVVVEEKELTAAEKEQILLEQEGFVAKKRIRWRVRKHSPIIEPKQLLELDKVGRQVGPKMLGVGRCHCETCFMSNKDCKLSCRHMLKPFHRLADSMNYKVLQSADSYELDYYRGSTRGSKRDVLASLESKGRPESSGSTPGWIKKALITKPPGRAEGLRAPVSNIGAKLNKNSTALRLWHEQVFNGNGRPVTGILLRQTKPPAPSELELCKPTSSFLRVAVPPEYGAALRISPEQQETAIEKGGHGAFKDAIVDKNVLLESIRRTNDPNQLKQEAGAVLCLGVLYDNGQDYTQAVENYKKFVEVCQKSGDVNGEAMGFNFIGCSLQEDQDNKLKTEKIEKVGPMGELELPTTAALQYEQALEYHEKHAEIAGLEGKYMAYTNIGLLQAALQRWTDAAKSHRKALKCATYMRRPEYQGVAVGNLAYLLLRRKKNGAARLCAKRYLQICEALQYSQGEARGHYMLGHIYAQQQKYSEAAEEFRTAVKIAKAIKDTDLEMSAKILIGVWKGKMECGKCKGPEAPC